MASVSEGIAEGDPNNDAPTGEQTFSELLAQQAAAGPRATTETERVEPSTQTAKEILALGRLTPDDACGAGPVNGLLLASKRRGLRPELIDLRNSGDTAGDKRRVVGYGAFAFYEK